MKTWHIHIKGQIQGVGFRPFVFVQAKENGLNGWVNNDMDGVHIQINSEKKEAYEFRDKVIAKAPDLAIVTSSRIFQVEYTAYKSFRIIHSKKTGKANLLLSPDFAICRECRKEIYSTDNHRKAYPFITCTNCGPRYSIISRLPYDRTNTAMDGFQKCSQCYDEYHNPQDRRYYSQTNSCPSCRINLSLYNSERIEIGTSQGEIIDLIIRYWREGKIIAIKGIGGFLLTCDAANQVAIRKIRKRKYRPTKPFALMHPDISSIKKIVKLTKEQEKELNSYVSPIIISEIKDVGLSSLSIDDIAPGLNQLGVMLPYAPLFEILLHKFTRPIVATSGNISNSSIVFENNQALNELSNVADFILVNDREILISQDDSVIKFSLFKKKKIIIRRSRGLAPSYINANLTWPTQTILSMGGRLKSTFSYLHQGNINISQYLGDLENFQATENYKRTINHISKLYNTQPEIILCDKHPDYESSQYGRHLSKFLNIPLKRIQHHIAHFGAVLGENNLIHSKESVLGVIWDGTGLGNDGQIWGGEFFEYKHYNFHRYKAFDYFDFILGDKMVREPRISALSICWDLVNAKDLLHHKFSSKEWQIYQTILSRENPLQTSSVGRIFDAVASVLGILDIQSYEGEASMLLEGMATQYFKKHGLRFESSYFEEDLDSIGISTKSLLANIIKELIIGTPKDYIAAKFHFSLVKLIKLVADNLGLKKLAFSGGVFQNGLLVDLIHFYLEKDYNLFFHTQLSPNDENISFGQLVCYQIQKANSQQL